VTAVKPSRRAVRAAASLSFASVAALVVAAAASPAAAAVRAESASDPGPGLTVDRDARHLRRHPGADHRGPSTCWCTACPRAGEPRDALVRADAQPVWFGAPDQPEHALEDAQPAPEAGGARGSWYDGLLSQHERDEISRTVAQAEQESVRALLGLRGTAR